MNQIWVAIDDATGEVSGVASIQDYTFTEAVALFAPREVRRMDMAEAIDSGIQYLKIADMKYKLVEGRET